MFCLILELVSPQQAHINVTKSLDLYLSDIFKNSCLSNKHLAYVLVLMRRIELVSIWKAVEEMLLSSSILLFYDYSLEDCMRDTARMWCDGSDMLRELLSYEDSVIQFNYHHFLNKTLCCIIDCERRKTNL